MTMMKYHFKDGEMKLVQSGNKWVLYGDDGKVIIITTTKRIAERMVK
jgi:hypothetical protein